MSRGAWRPTLQSVLSATLTLALAAPAAAQPGGLSARAEVAVGGMLANYQRAALGYGSIIAGGVRAGYAPVEPLVLQLGYFAWYGPSGAGAGSQHTFEAGARLEVPLGWRMRPWVDGQVGYARTGSLGRLAISAAAGLELDVASFLSLGPYVRYGHTFATSADHPGDAQMLVGGLTVTMRVAQRRRALVRARVFRDADADGVGDDDDTCPRIGAGDRPDPNRSGCPTLDGDRDGVSDRDDVCPSVPAGLHPEIARPGCPAADTDGDGLLDREDACPSTPVGAHPDPYRIGCPDGDDDGDGMLNAIDRCRSRHHGPTPDPVTPGCPLPDRDSDGVPDATDRCLNDAGAPSTNPLRHGCPGLVRIAARDVRTLRAVTFAPDADRILPASVPVLASLADVLRATPWIQRLSIEASADVGGGGAVGRALGERRAASVMAWLVAHGIAASRLETHALGAPEAPASEATQARRPARRSIALRITRSAGDSAAEHGDAN